jgi:hypothetical protein
MIKNVLLCCFVSARMSGVVIEQNFFLLRQLFSFTFWLKQQSLIQIIDVLHPGRAGVARTELKEKLAKMFKVKDTNTIILFGFQIGKKKKSFFFFCYCRLASFFFLDCLFFKILNINKLLNY